jgi:phosphonate transport system permease protein
MTDAAAGRVPPRIERQDSLAFLTYAAVIAVLVWAFQGSGWSAEKLAEAPSWLGDFLSRAWPPSPANLDRLAWKMVETLQIALAGAAAGVLVSLPIALLAARGLIAGRWLSSVIRMLLGFTRAVPDIAWALLFVIGVGLGPFAGALAIMIDTIGYCARFFADEMEAADRGPAEALTATGARPLDVAVCAVVPAAMPGFISVSLYALERAVRASTILGLVGAGGIGIELKVAFDLFDYPAAMTVILLIAVVVVLVEQLGMLARRRIIGEAR